MIPSDFLEIGSPIFKGANFTRFQLKHAHSRNQYKGDRSEQCDICENLEKDN